MAYKTNNKCNIMIIISTIILLGNVLFIYACNDSVENENPQKYILVQTDKTEYYEGEIIVITLYNNSKESIFSHIGSGTPVFCIKNVEKKQKKGIWKKYFAQSQSNEVHRDIDGPNEIKPGQSVSLEWKPLIFSGNSLESIIPSIGRYRLSILYEDYKKTKWMSIYSNEFEFITNDSGGEK